MDPTEISSQVNGSMVHLTQQKKNKMMHSSHDKCSNLLQHMHILSQLGCLISLGGKEHAISTSAKVDGDPAESDVLLPSFWILTLQLPMERNQEVHTSSEQPKIHEASLTCVACTEARCYKIFVAALYL